MSKEAERNACEGCGRWHGPINELIHCLEVTLREQRAARMKAEQAATRAVDIIIAVRNVVR